MSTYKKSLWAVLGLIVTVSAVLAVVSGNNSVLAQWVAPAADLDANLKVHTRLVQDKVLAGSDGRLAVALTLTAPVADAPADLPTPASDLVIVLDRSGSMKGAKLHNAQQAIRQLIDRLGPDDRLSLVAYANQVSTIVPLTVMDAGQQPRIREAVGRIHAGGGTNLGGGLYHGIETLMQAPADGRQRKLILISDGLANQGITQPEALGNMASGAVEHDYSVSTVGVGYDFNEVLMTTIADHGAGRYYFLENPDTFARVFEKELQSTRDVTAAGLEIRVPLSPGVELIDAGGYPVRVRDGMAVIHPGDLRSGQQRKLFLTYRAHARKPGPIDLGVIEVRYHHNGSEYAVAADAPLQVACVADEAEVISSIDQAVWGEQVVKQDYNQLKEEVADAIRNGDKRRALQQIQVYEGRQRGVNAVVGSAKVTKNLDEDVKQLRDSVEDTFAGSPSAVAEKKKRKSKALQYESYQMRRDKQ